MLRRQCALVPYEVRWSGSVEDVRLAIHIPGARSTAVAEAAVAEVRRLFGLDFDLPGFYRMAKADAARLHPRITGSGSARGTPAGNGSLGARR